MTRPWFTILPLLLLSSTAFAAAGKEGAAFLGIPVGGRPAALGSAYTALANDAYAPIWNPAGLGRLSAYEVAGQHLSYLESMNYEFVGAAIPLGKTRRHGLGAGIQYLGTGDIPERGPNGEEMGDFSAYYAAYTLSYGARITERLSGGLSVKRIEGKLSDTRAAAIAADLGTSLHINDSLSFGAAVRNLGDGLKFDQSKDPLPSAFNIGAAWQPRKQYLLTSEAVIGFHGTYAGRFGLEWRPLSMIALRAGYRTDTVKGLSALAGLTTGLGLELWGQEFSYAWLPQSDLGDTQYFSMKLRFSQDAQEERNLINAKSVRAVPKKPTNPTIDQELEEMIGLLRDNDPNKPTVAEQKK